MHADKQDSTSSQQQNSADADKLPAGCCSPRRFDIELESSPHYARRHCPANGGSGARQRCDVAMIVTPKESDPPPPRQITDCVKAGGACKEELSQPTWARQQPDARSVLQRSRSLPPESTRNPITSGGCGSGTSNKWECHNSSRPMLFATAEVAELTNHTMLSMEAVDRRAKRLACEQKFADLCTLTEATASMRSRSLAQSRNESSSMGSALAWNA